MTYAIERETKAALLIKEAIAAAGEAGDEDLLVGCIEGETGLMEQIDKLLQRGADIEAMTDALDKVVKDAQARKARFKASGDAIRNILFQVLKAIEMPKVERPLATLTLRAGSKRITITDESLLADEFFKIEKTVSLAAIAQAFKDHRTVAGATTVIGEQSLTVKRT